MSEDAIPDNRLGGDVSVEAGAADWFERNYFEIRSEADHARFAAWLAESPAHEIAYWRLEGAWARTKRLVALQIPHANERQGLFLLRIAAAIVVIAAVVGSYWFYFSQPRGNIYATSIGHRQTVLLPEGSKMELNTDSVARVAYTSRRRAIWLKKGEAYFEAVHDAARPLVIFAGDRRVTDLGTKFVMRQGHGLVEVAVVEGRVSLEGTSETPGSHALLLSQGDTVVSTETSMSVVRRPLKEISDELGWRLGVIVFHNTPLREAAAEFNRYNLKKIVIADASAARFAINGTMPADDTQEFAAVLRKLFGLRVATEGNEIVVSR